MPNRYTISEAINLICIHEEGINKPALFKELESKVKDGEIKTYRPGEKAPPYRVNPYGWSNESASNALAEDLETVEMYSHDLNTWLDASHTPLQWRFPKSIDNTSPPISIKRIPVQEEQERIILETVCNLGYKPLELPKKQKTGRRWVRSEVGKILKESPHNWTKDQFSNAWGRLIGGQLKEEE